MNSPDKHDLFGETTQPTPSHVIAYHDESEEPFTAHACLLVPVARHDALLRELASSRTRWRCYTKLHFTDFSGAKWGASEKCASWWIGAGVEALRRKGQTVFAQPIGCRLGVILFDRQAQVQYDLFAGEKRERKVCWNETLLRVMLKCLGARPSIAETGS